MTNESDGDVFIYRTGNGRKVRSYGVTVLGGGMAVIGKVGVQTAGADVSAANPLAVSTPQAVPVCGQKVVSTSPSSLGSSALVNGVTIKAKSTNVGSVWVGGSIVTATDNGTGNGFALAPGEAVSFAVANLAAIYVIGANTTDIVYFAGN